MIALCICLVKVLHPCNEWDLLQMFSENLLRIKKRWLQSFYCLNTMAIGCLGMGRFTKLKKFGLRIWICCDTQECCNVESSKTTKNIFWGEIAYWKLVLKINIAKFDVAYIDVTLSFLSCFLLNGCFDTKHACFPPESMQGTIKICL